MAVRGLSDIVKIIQKNIVGETITIKTISLITIGGRLCSKRHPMSLNVMLNDQGGIGKDFVVSSIRKVIDSENWQHFPTPTPAAITLTQVPNKDGTVLKPITSNTIIYIEDASPAFTNGENTHFKLLLDGDVTNYPVVNKMRSWGISWKKPVVILTTAEASPNNQILRRIPQLSLDNSVKQTQAICKRIADIETGRYEGITVDDVLNVKKFIDSLKPYKVAVSKETDDSIRSEFLEPNYDKIFLRTLTNRIYDYTKFSALIHQFDREKKDKQTILTNTEDFKLVKDIVTTAYKIDVDDELSQFNTRQKGIIKRLKKEKRKFTVNQIAHWKCTADVSEQTVYTDMKKIVREHDDIKLYTNRHANMPNEYGVDDDDDDIYGV